MHNSQMVTAPALFILVLLAAGPFDSAHAIVPSHCTTNEVTLFTCTMQKNHEKVLSLCGLKGWQEGAGLAEYRYGKLDKVELQFQGDDVSRGKGFTSDIRVNNSTVGNKVTRTSLHSLSFPSGNTVYSIFERKIAQNEVDDRGRPVDESEKKEAGVEVKLGKDKTVTLLCDEDYQSTLNVIIPDRFPSVINNQIQCSKDERLIFACISPDKHRAGGLCATNTELSAIYMENGHLLARYPTKPTPYKTAFTAGSADLMDRGSKIIRASENEALFRLYYEEYYGTDFEMLTPAGKKIIAACPILYEPDMILEKMFEVKQ